MESEKLAGIEFVVKYGALSLLCAYILPYSYQLVKYIIGLYITVSISSGKY